MADVLAQRIYDIQIQGYEQSFKNLQSLTSAFEKLDTTKRKTDEQLKKAIDSGNASAVERLTKRLNDLEKQLSNLDKQRQNSAKEVEALAKAEKLEAEAALVRTKNIIAQEKELDRQIATEERRAKKVAESTKAQGQNYYALFEAMKKANEAYRMFDPSSGDKSGFEKVKNAAMEAKAKVDAFNRSLSPDGTLVGEYKTGIINAFKSLGLTDIIKKQRDDINNELRKLGDQSKSLAQQLREVGSSGSEAFSRIRQELTENLHQQERLSAQLTNIDTQLQGVGSVGQRITSSIKEGFSGLTKQAAQFALGYIGFSKAISEVQASIADAKQLEGITAAFNNLNKPGLLDELRKATRGTVSDLELMKRAVSAENFQIPLEQLASLMDFARRRAKDTGMSVDYLVDSIVTGIGRKSPLILDNLGISAVRLREKMKGVSEENQSVGDVAKAVAQIIAEENAKAGAEIDTQSEKIAQSGARWENIRTAIGQRLLPVIASLGAVLLGVVSIIAKIPFPILIAGITTLTGLIIANTIASNAASLALVRRIALRTVANALETAATFIETAQAAATWVLTAAQNAYNASVAWLNRVLPITTTLFRVLGNAIRATPLGWILTGVILLTTAFSAFGSKLSQTTTTLKESAQALRNKALAAELDNEASKKAVEATASQVAQLNQLKKSLESANVPLKQKQTLLENAKKSSQGYLDALSLTERGELKNVDAIKEYIKVLKEKAKEQALSEIRTEKTKRLMTLELELPSSVVNAKTEEERQRAIQNLVKGTSSARNAMAGGGVGGFGASIMDNVFGQGPTSDIKAKVSEWREITASMEILDKRLENFDKRQLGVDDGSVPKGYSFLERFNRLVKGGGSDKEFDDLLNEVKKKRETTNRLSNEYKELVALEKKINDFLNPKGSDSKLSNEQRDRFKNIDAERDQAIAIELQRVLEIKKIRELTLKEEEEHINKIARLNSEAISKKIAVLESSKNLNAEERKVLAELRKQKVEIEVNTQKEIQQAREKQYATQTKQLEQYYSNLKDVSESRLKESLQNQNQSETDKANAQLSHLELMLSHQRMFNSQQEALEKELGVKSIENEAKRAKAIIDWTNKINDAKIVVLNSKLKDIENSMNQALNEQKQITADQTIKILQDDNLTDSQKSKQLKRLEDSQTLNYLNAEIAGMRLALETKEALLLKGLISQKEYSDAVTRLKEKEAEKVKKVYEQEQTYISKLVGTLKDGWNNITGFFKDFKLSAEDSKEELDNALQKTGEIVQQAISDAYNNYWEGEKQKVDDAKQVALDRLNIEQQQAEGTAQSEREKETIRRQFDAKRKAEEKKASQEKKEIALKQASIDFGLAVIKTLAAYPFPFSLIPVAGLTVAYLMQRAQIQGQKFKRGGSIQKAAWGAVLGNGGVFEGASHDDGGNKFMFGNAPVETEAKEAYVINKHSTQSSQRVNVSGTPKQIASALNSLGGGISFAPGASLRKLEYGGSLGAGLSAPVNPSAFLSGTGAGDINGIYAAIAQQTDNITAVAKQTNERIDKLKVQVVAREVVDTDSKIKQAELIATL